MNINKEKVLNNTSGRDIIAKMYQSIYQRSIEREVSATGVGIHSGNPVTMRLVPAKPGEGIQFVLQYGGANKGTNKVTDTVKIPAHFSMVKNTMLATTLTSGDANISTVEHLMATLSAFSVDNLTIYVDGSELPVMDGSAAELVLLLNSGGIVETKQKREFAVVTDKISVKSGDSWATLTPKEGGLFIDYTIVYENPHVGTQRFEFKLTPDFFVKEIAPARTFGLLEDVQSMYKQGLALGGTLENALIIGDDGVLNPDGFRFPDECVRHKCLDALGDLALFGMPIIGKFTAYKSGHMLNHLLVKELSESGKYHIVEGRAEEKVDL